MAASTKAMAIVATIGNLIQGCDNAMIASAILYIKRDFNLKRKPSVEGLLVSMSLIGATFVNFFAGPLADRIGRRRTLMVSAFFYIVGGLIMVWSPNVLVLTLGRTVVGLGVGLAVTVVPMYISETAPSETRGQLNTLPQLSGSSGMLVAYCMVFVMILYLMDNWRFMLGALAVPALVYLVLIYLYLPESPRWLVSKGRIKEAESVLQTLRCQMDVSAELKLLLEGLGSGGDTTIEEFVVAPAAGAAGDEEQQVRLYGPEQGLSWVAQPVPSGSSTMLGSVVADTRLSRPGSMYELMKDPVVALLESVHEKMPSEAGTRGSALLPNLGSMPNNVAEKPAAGNWDEENVAPRDDVIDDEEHASDDDKGVAALQKPLLWSRQQALTKRRSSMTTGGAETASTSGIGGGWQLAWKCTQDVGSGGVKRVYMHEDEAAAGTGEYVHATALVSRSRLYTMDELIGGQGPTPAKKTPGQTSLWREMQAPGVMSALLCGTTMQVLQQLSGINGVLYYTPQILEQAGVGVLLASLGLSAEATSILISGVTTLLMIPSIGVAMRLMDVVGRRSLLLWTIPVLILSLVVLVVANVVPMAATTHAALSTVSVIVYFCFFVMGFGPIPNILCAEIFPTRVRGICITVCSLAFWLGDIAVTYSLPVMLNSVGLAGVFGFYAVMCCIAFVFVALKVPETKGMPLEVITEFFKIGANTITDDKQDNDDDKGNQQQ